MAGRPADRLVRAVHARVEPGPGRLRALLGAAPAGRRRRRRYADAPDLVLLRLDPARIPAEIRYEDGFPHVYGPIPVAAVTSAEPLHRDSAGQFVLPGAAVADADAAVADGDAGAGDVADAAAVADAADVTDAADD